MTRIIQAKSFRNVDIESVSELLEIIDETEERLHEEHSSEAS